MLGILLFILHLSEEFLLDWLRLILLHLGIRDTKGDNFSGDWATTYLTGLDGSESKALLMLLALLLVSWLLLLDT